MTDEPVKSLPKWEYMVTTKQTERHMILELKQLGFHGWEALSITYNKDLKDCWCWTAWLKRPWTGLADTTGELSGEQSQTGEAEKAPLSGFDLSEGDFEFKD